jgi:hypothetical protein
MNTTKFINRAIQKHGHLYDYDKVIYKKYHTKVSIICPRHGIFNQTPAEHLRGSACPKCFRDKQRLTKDEFVRRATEIHQNKYDYTLVNYKNTKTKVSIICQQHGNFKQSPLVHLNGSGCPTCYSSSIINSTKRFIVEAQKIHGDTYGYDDTEYVNHKSHVNIRCKIHGNFKQKTRNHLSGAGCPACARITCLLSTEQFLIKANIVHYNKYRYKSTYIGAFSHIIINCPEHGDFKQLPSNHLQGAGCPQCAHQQQLSTTAEFVDKAQLVHNNKYNYSLVTYTTALEKIIVKCPTHGDFEQKANNHLNGQGCPHCHTIISSGHDALKLLIPSDVAIIDNDRSVIAPHEIDIFLPDYKIGIEYHGNYWHSQSSYRPHDDKYKCLKKHNKAVQNGINLLQFFEYEIKDDIIKSMITHALKRSLHTHARKCSVIQLTNSEATNFFDNNHLFGHRTARYYYALEYNDSIVIALSISRHTKHQFEIIRLATVIGHSIVGGFSKLLSSFIKDHSPQTIMTFADKRFSTGQAYKQTGFKLINSTKPNYKYIDLSTKQILSRQKCQKHKLHKLLGATFNQNQSESENMLNNGYGRIWDAGHYQFLLII